MNGFAVATREGTRLVRFAPTRSAIIGVTIAAATAIGVRDGPLALPCGAFSVAVISVARRSPRPERLECANAWNRAGSGRFPIWMSGTFEALILAWVPALVGGLIGIVLLETRGSRAAFGDGVAFIPWQLGALGLAACLPTSRAAGPDRSHGTGVMAGVGGAARVATVIFAVFSMFGLALHVRTDLDLAISGLFVIVLLVIVGLVVTGPVSRGAITALGRLPRGRAFTAIAARYRTPATVRLVVVAAVTVATATSILGASIEARPDTRRALERRLAALPVLPRNVALLRLEVIGGIASTSALDSPFTTADLGALRATLGLVAPGAEIIPLHDVRPEDKSVLPFCAACAGTVVVAEPRLRSIYGRDAQYPAPFGIAIASPFSTTIATRVPSTDDLLAETQRGKPLPAATFDGAEYYEVPARAAAGDTKAVTNVFIRAPRPFTSAQLHRLAGFARALRPAPGVRVTLIAPKGPLVPTAIRPAPVALSPSLREASWAATSPGSRWALAILAGVIALLTLLVTLAIDTIDRRADVERLERLGATPRQVRGAAAAYAAVLLAVVTWVCALLVIALVRFGTSSFNHAEPAIPVPFTMPWAIVLLLTVGLPAVGAGLAALVVRPTLGS